MWILPKNHPLSSVYVQESEVLNEELKEHWTQSSEPLLMLKSKPLLWPTLLRAWKRVYWIQHLFGRILKPSLGQTFTERYTESLAVIHASPQEQELLQSKEVSQSKNCQPMILSFRIQDNGEGLQILCEETTPILDWYADMESQIQSLQTSIHITEDPKKGNGKIQLDSISTREANLNGLKQKISYLRKEELCFLKYCQKNEIANFLPISGGLLDDTLQMDGLNGLHQEGTKKEGELQYVAIKPNRNFLEIKYEQQGLAHTTARSEQPTNMPSPNIGYMNLFSSLGEELPINTLQGKSLNYQKKRQMLSWRAILRETDQDTPKSQVQKDMKSQQLVYLLLWISPFYLKEHMESLLLSRKTSCQENTLLKDEKLTKEIPIKLESQIEIKVLLSKGIMDGNLQKRISSKENQPFITFQLNATKVMSQMEQLYTTANHFQTQESGEAQKTLGTSGHTSLKEYEQFNLFGASLKTSAGTLLSDMKLSGENYKKWVTELRKESLQRRKLAHHTEEKGSSSLQSWTTPTVHQQNTKYQQGGSPLPYQVQQNWATPRVFMFKDAKEDRGKSNLGEQVMNPKNWPTPTTQEVEHPEMKISPNGRRIAKNGNTHSIGLADQVKQNWPTPTTAEASKIGNCANYGQKGLSNHPSIVGETTREKLVKSGKEIDGHPDQEKTSAIGKNREQLNPAWVAQLMGTSLEKTFFVPMATEWSNKPQS